MGKIIKSVSLSYEIGKQFDNYENFSQLVEKLLTQHLAINPELLKQEIQMKTQVLEKIKETIDSEEQITQAKAEKLVNAQKEREIYIQAKFKQDLGRELSEAELKDYFELLQADLTNYFKFLESLQNGTI